MYEIVNVIIIRIEFSDAYLYLSQLSGLTSMERMTVGEKMISRFISILFHFLV